MKRKAFLLMWDSLKPKMTTSATLGLGKNCPHNKRTKLVVLYYHWSSLIWHEEEGFPSNVGLSKAKNDYKCNTWSRKKLSPQFLLDKSTI